MQPVVTHDEAGGRFVVRVGSEVAELTYQWRGRAMDLYHTEVPPAFRGQGIAERLADAAFNYADAHGLSVIPSCPYISGVYLTRHPERQRLVAGDDAG